MLVWEDKIIEYTKGTDTFSLVWDIKQLEHIYVSSPLSIWWLITWKCNLQCIHCYGNQEELPNQEITIEEAKIICDNIIDSWIYRVSISWWEPMIRKDIFDIVNYLSSYWISVIVSTNWLNVKENISKLKKLRHIEISLDWGVSKIHDDIRPARNSNGGAFDIAIEAITAAVDDWILTRVLTTLNKYNINKLDAIWKILSDLWVQEWHIWKTTNAWRARFIYNDLMDGVIFNDELHKKLQEKYPKIKIQFNYPSKASKYYALILPDGCMYTQDYISWEKIKLWSLIEYPLSKFWNQENFDIKGHYIKRLNLNPSSFI